MDKARLRKNALSARRVMPTNDVSLLSTQIAERLWEAVDWVNVQRVHLYTPHLILKEVDTSKIYWMLNSRMPQVIVTMGEPSVAAQIPVGDFDLIIVPMVAFDSKCQRIGFGGGWYDKFLSSQPGAQKIGLAFEMQRVERIPEEAHDIALDAVITETQTYNKKQKSPQLRDDFVSGD